MIKRFFISVLLVGLALLLPVGRSWAGFNDVYKFGPSANLGGQINSPYNDTDPYLSADGNTIFFSSDRPGGYGSYDIYSSQKINGIWQEPVNLGLGINSDRSEFSPVISPDGKKLFLITTRGLPSDYYSRIWVSENIDGVWQPPTQLPSTVNLSWANNNVEFITADGRWLYMSCFISSFYMWDIFRVDLTVPGYTSIESVYRSTRRDVAVAMTSDSKYFIMKVEETRVVWELIDGVLSNSVRPVSPVTQPGFTFGDNDATGYYNAVMPGGFGGYDIYAAPRIWPCSALAITSFTGTGKTINPLPLAGQGVDLVVAVADASLVHNATWTLFLDDRVVASGSGLPKNLRWDGRTADGIVAVGSHELRVVLAGNGGECGAEKKLPVSLDMTDECMLQVVFP